MVVVPVRAAREEWGEAIEQRVGEVVEIEQIRAEVVEDCRTAGIPSVIENLIYPLPGETPLTREQRATAIIESARLLDDLGPDLLKLEYPGSPAACRRLVETITAPWAVLSAGVDFDVFTDVLKVSCDEGGASGIIAGRALWKDAVGMERERRRAFLADEGLRRLEGCVAAIDGRARPRRSSQPPPWRCRPRRPQLVASRARFRAAR